MTTLNEVASMLEDAVSTAQLVGCDLIAIDRTADFVLLDVDGERFIATITRL